jgi:Protein of unknown function (DUF3800)
MHLLFVDESGTPPRPGIQSRYFVVAGVIVPEAIWHRLRDAILGLKLRYKIRGEIKWRYFAPGNDDLGNPMKGLDQVARNQIRTDMIKIITSESSIKTLGCICSAAAAYEIPSNRTPADLYHATYKPLTERFQYYLQDVSRSLGVKQFGIIVADHRGKQEDTRLRSHHQKLLYAKAEYISKYGNLIEGLFLQPSNLSVGIQFADLVAGAIWRKFERGDATWFDLLLPSIRKSTAGSIEGHGIVKYPKENWR